MLNINIDTVLDASGLNCPLPLLKTKQALHKMSSGSVLKVIATDAGSVRDITVFIEHSDHDLLDTFIGETEYVYIIRCGLGVKK
ncbi:sulfurtransferase TusA family protein [Neptunomonas phycophila]|uniref:sulfurtransferase TusA family protein n=1 Tax=Neptunomonas phycophila TaxID=1572645 RepID=UPI001BE8F811|nr:sulfurtransferase TusA family protein [Neptunomonas phycophila]MBT3147309.1 sulfurtransferase TusA family protein [Neptunomonas phycophila]